MVREGSRDDRQTPERARYNETRSEIRARLVWFHPPPTATDVSGSAPEHSASTAHRTRPHARKMCLDSVRSMYGSSGS